MFEIVKNITSVKQTDSVKIWVKKKKSNYLKKCFKLSGNKYWSSIRIFKNITILFF